MKKTILSLGALMFVLACAPPADGGGGGGGGGADAGAPPADTGNTPAPDAGTTPPADTGPAPSTDAGPSDDKCTNDADQAAMTTINQSNNTMADIAKSCGLSCFQNEGATFSSACVIDCMRTASQSSVSDECLGCYGGSVLCTRDNCLFQCSQDPDSTPCVNCMCGNNRSQTNCYTVFSQCSGIPYTEECN